MDFRILGPLEVLDEGRVVPIAGTKQRALLALLLLHGNETLTTDRLIDELWGERPQPSAVKALRIMIEEQPMPSRTLQPEEVLSQRSTVQPPEPDRPSHG